MEERIDCPVCGKPAQVTKFGRNGVMTHCSQVGCALDMNHMPLFHTTGESDSYWNGMYELIKAVHTISTAIVTGKQNGRAHV